MPFQTHPSSRLRFALPLSVDGVEFWDVLSMPPIPEQSDDTFYYAQSGDRLDLLAASIYRDDALAWVLALANDLELPQAHLNAGTRLRIPSERYITQEYLPRVATRRTL